MRGLPNTATAAPARVPCRILIVVGAVLVGCSIQGKLTATQRGEYFNIARALSSGQGFAHCFGDPVGPTAWMAPVYPTLLAGLYWLGDGDRKLVTAILVFLHLVVLMGTAGLVLTISQQTTRNIGMPIAAAVFLLGPLFHFRRWFNYVDDAWLILLILDLLIAGPCWLRPLERWPQAAGWGFFGGCAALTNPILGFVWGILSLAVGVRRRAWARLAVTLSCAALTLAPWTIRNYLVFGRLVPVKSNLAFELFQSQCLQPDGLLQSFRWHPSGPQGPEGREYRQVGEARYLDRKWQRFQDAVAADPVNFFDRVAARFLGATLWYVPFNRTPEANPAGLLWLKRVTFPLPFLAILLLVGTNRRGSRSMPQGTVIGVFFLYLLPYIATSYYERYALPLLAVKSLLIIWGIDRAFTLCPTWVGRGDRRERPGSG